MSKKDEERFALAYRILLIGGGAFISWMLIYGIYEIMKDLIL